MEAGRLSGLKEEIERVRQDIDNVSRQLSETLLAIDAEAHKKRLSTIEHAENSRAMLRARLFHLTAAATGSEDDRSGVEVSGSAHEAQPAKRPAADVILELLSDAEAPVSASDLDAAVIAEGWTKAAAEKAKLRLRENSLVVSEKRHYSITEAGRNKIGGQEPAS